MVLRNVKTRTGKYVHRAYVYEVSRDGKKTLHRHSVICNQVPVWCYSLAVTDEPVTCSKCLERKR